MEQIPSCTDSLASSTAGTSKLFDQNPSLLLSFSCTVLSDSSNSIDRRLSVHRIPQTKILGWVAKSSSTGSSWPKDQTRTILYITNGFVRSFIGCLFIHFSFNKYLLILMTTFSDTEIGIERTVMSKTDFKKFLPSCLRLYIKTQTV